MQVENAIPAASADTSAAEAGNEVNATQAEAKTETPVETKPQKLKVKAAGKEEELTVDELVRRYQGTAGYAQKAQDILKTSKEVEALQAKFKDPRKALETLFEMHGDSAREVIEEMYRAQQQEREQLSQLTDRERQMYQAYRQQQQQLEHLSAFKQQQEQQQAQAYEAQAVEALREEVGNITVAALQAADIPDGIKGEAMRWMLPLIQEHFEAGIQPDPTALGKQFQAEMAAMTDKYIRTLSPKTILKTMPDVAKAMAMAFLEQAQSGMVKSKATQQPIATQPRQDDGPRYTNRWDTIKKL